MQFFFIFLKRIRLLMLFVVGVSNTQFTAPPHLDEHFTISYELGEKHVCNAGSVAEMNLPLFLKSGRGRNKTNVKFHLECYAVMFSNILI